MRAVLAKSCLLVLLAAAGPPNSWAQAQSASEAVLLADVVPGTEDGLADRFGRRFFRVGGHVLFFSANRDQLWTSDGTPRWTQPLDLPSPSVIRAELFVGARGFERLLVSVSQGETSDLWITDGTPRGTELLLRHGEFEPGVFTSSSQLDVIFFLRPQPDGSRAIWATNGSRASFDRLTGDLPTETSWISTFSLGPRTFLRAHGSQGPIGLWETDGTPDGTQTRTLTPASGPNPVGRDGSAYYITADSLWRSDLDDTPSIRVADLSSIKAEPWTLTFVGERPFFTAQAAEDGLPYQWIDLMTVDPMASEATRLGRYSYWPRNAGIFRSTLGDRHVVFEMQSDNLDNLWSFDSTGVAVNLLACAPRCTLHAWDFSVLIPGRLFRDDRRIIFPMSEPENAGHPATGREFWITDGTPSGTQLLVDSCPGPCSTNLVLPFDGSPFVGDNVVFGALDESSLQAGQLVVLDHRSGRLRTITDFSRLRGQSTPGRGVTPTSLQYFRSVSLHTVGHRVVFLADDGVHGGEPWGLEIYGTPSCLATATTLCFGGGRFAAEATWTTDQGDVGKGRSRTVTPDTGAFWFFDDDNLELVVKVLDACAFSESYWAFAAGLTDVGVELTITDTVSGVKRTYSNPAGRPFEPVQDVAAFPCQ